LRSSTGQAREIVYPHPGSPLPLVHVFTVQLADGTPVEMRTDPANGFYLPLLRWLPDSRHLAIERIDRFQRNLELLLSDSQTGRTKTIVTETDKYWINISDILYFFHDGKSFLWSSERSGFRHLYLYSSQGKQLSQITKGDWEVTCLDAVDEKRGLIYFTATMQSPLERQLYRLHLDGSDISRITQQPGTHEPHFASDATHFVDQFSSHAIAPQLTIASVDHSSAEDKLTLPAVLVPETANIAPSITHHDDAPTASSTLHAEQAPAAPDLLPVEFLPIKLHLGAETSAFLIRPPNFDPTHKYPVILYVAGGPGEQLVRDAWGGAAGLWMQSMAQNGFIVFALDNQGTSGRGHYFEEPIHLRLGAQELADQRDGLVYLANLPYVDVKRLGICGWGYGGFLVLHAMLDRPVPFKVGFAGAPVADWHLYDATFAEKYLDDPVAHADGWSASTAFENDTPRFFKGSLMVAQGTEDEFVHLENTARIQQELLNAGKFVTNLSFPDRGHSIKDFPARIGLYRAMTDFFVKNL
jgi:dipeptidyl-peptidase-4